MRNFIENLNEGQKAALVMVLAMALLGETISGVLTVFLGYGLARATSIGMLVSFVGTAAFMTILGLMLMLLGMIDM